DDRRVDLCRVAPVDPDVVHQGRTLVTTTVRMAATAVVPTEKALAFRERIRVLLVFLLDRGIRRNGARLNGAHAHGGRRQGLRRRLEVACLTLTGAQCQPCECRENQHGTRSTPRSSIGTCAIHRLAPWCVS